MFNARVLRYGPWSLSKAGTLQTCTQQFDFKYVKKLKETSKGAQAQVGVVGHKVLELMGKSTTHALSGRGEHQKTLSEVTAEVCTKYKLPTTEERTVQAHVPWIQDYLTWRDAYRGAVDAVEEYSELELGMTASYEPSGFKDDPTTFFRGVIDYAIRTKDNYLIIWDHKSGRRKAIQEHHAQLYSYMLLAMVRWPELRGFQCGINYFGRSDIDWFPRHDGTSGAWTSEEVVKYVVPWFEQYLNTLTKRLTVLDQAPAGTPEPGWACDYCGFVDRCPEGQQKVAERQAKRTSNKQV